MMRRRKNRRGRGTDGDPNRWSTAIAGRPALPAGTLSLMAVLMASLLAGLAAAPAAAQDACDEGAGTLGIQGLRCEGCSYSMSESGIDEARFRTEPQVMAVVRGFTEGDRLRAGDYIVAIDGALVTTRAGGARLVNLEAGQALTLRVRRDGRVMELAMVAGSACDLRRHAREGEVELERVPGAEYGVYVGEAPPAPLPPAAGVRVAPPLPAMPPMPDIPPSGYLGFGLTCGPCGVRDGVRFFDANPPTVNNVVDGGPADRAGLRPNDVILAIDGLDITSEEGGRRFSEIEAGDRFELTVRRGDARRSLTIQAGERVTARVAPAPMPAPPAPGLAGSQLQFEGTVGGVSIEVRGVPITVTRDEETGELIIWTAGNRIRLRATGSR